MEALRDTARELRRLERSKCRTFAYNDKRVALGSIEERECKQISAEQVRAIATGFKGTLEQLTLLTKALIQHDNIEAFIHVEGAMYGLVKQLSGQNASLQLAAAHCCCNLALGNNKQCLVVTRATAAYLISYLQGANAQLVDVCAWTLGNLAACGGQSWSILHDQGASHELVALLHVSSPTVHGPAVYALSHIINTGGQDMSTSELQSVAAVACLLLRNNPPGVAWLVFLLSCHACCDRTMLDHRVAHAALALLPDVGTTDATALLRVLANLATEPDGCVAGALLDDTQLPAALATLATREVAWLVGNVANHVSGDVRARFGNSALRTQVGPRLVQARDFMTSV